MTDSTSAALPMPVHTGIIMDGNGRWAQQRGKARTAGHQAGLETAKEIVRAASALGLRYLSLYTWSTENWRRTVEEVNFLMDLLAKNLRKEYAFYRENDIRVIHSGDLEGLPAVVRQEILAVEGDTASFQGLTVNLLINYGGRDELARAFRRLVERGVKAQEVDEAAIRSALDHPELPDIDLLIRTSGELRTSNFLLWQSAYAELHFSDKLWPDWTAADLHAAIEAYGQRRRRFGGSQ